jgi:SSS family transporter
MEEQRYNIILSAVAVYLIACIGVGIWAMKRTKSSQDFFMAGRNLGFLVTGCAIFSSIMSGFGFVGGPGLVYSMGMSSVWIVCSATAGFSLSFFLLSKRLRLISEIRQTVSLPAAIAARYRSETTRFLSAVAIVLGVIGYLGTQILAMATVLGELFKNHPSLGEIPLEVSVGVSCAVLVFYCVTGGIIASVYTDTLQGLVMVVAAILVFIAAVGAIDGGMAGAGEVLLRDDPESISPWGSLGMIGCLSWFFLFAFGGAGQPHVITKMMMTRDVRDAKRVLPLTIVAYCLCALLWIGVGIVMRALVLQGEHDALTSTNDAAPQFLQHYAHPLLAGLVFAGLFAAIMSTADSFLNIGAAACVHDIPKALTGRTLKNELFWARVATVILVAVSASFALYYGDLIALLGAFGWGTFAAALVPTVAIGFNWKRATATAANVAIVTSLVFNFTVKLADWKLPYGISEGAVSLLISLTLFFGISLLSKPPVLDEDIEAVMDL